MESVLCGCDLPISSFRVVLSTTSRIRFLERLNGWMMTDDNIKPASCCRNFGAFATCMAL